MENPTRTCTIDGCGGKHRGLGYCNKHYCRYLRHGDPLAGQRMRTSPLQSTMERLTTIGWTERLVIPELGPCWEWRGRVKPDGYGVIDMGTKAARAHRVAYEVWVGPITDESFACHRCDNPPCMNPKHIFLGKALDNSDDCREKARIAHGEKHYLFKLTDIQVQEIRDKYASGMYLQRELAKEYGVVRQSIGKIVRGQNRKFVTGVPRIY